MAARRQWSDLSQRTRRLLTITAVASKPDPRPEVDVGHGGDGRQLRRGRANLILHLRAAAASIAARLIRATAGKQGSGAEAHNTR